MVSISLNMSRFSVSPIVELVRTYNHRFTCEVKHVTLIRQRLSLECVRYVMHKLDFFKYFLFYFKDI